MKKQLFLYLFIIAALMNVFTYVYFTRKQQSEKVGNTAQNDGTVTTTSRDSIQMLQEKLIEAEHFSLENNDNAQEYFQKSNLDYNELIPKIKDALLEFNTNKEGNKYVDQVGYDNKMYLINKIKILNHRWIIADYSNGEMWGEVLLKYFVNDDKTITFQTVDSYLYTKPIVTE